MARPPVNPVNPPAFIGRVFALEGVILTAVEHLIDVPGATIESKRKIIDRFRQNAIALAKQALTPHDTHPLYPMAIQAAEDFVAEQFDLLEKNLVAMAGEDGRAAAPAKPQKKS